MGCSCKFAEHESLFFATDNVMEAARRYVHTLCDDQLITPRQGEKFSIQVTDKDGKWEVEIEARLEWMFQSTHLWAKALPSPDEVANTSR